MCCRIKLASAVGNVKGAINVVPFCSPLSVLLLSPLLFSDWLSGRRRDRNRTSTISFLDWWAIQAGITRSRAERKMQAIREFSH